VRECTLGDAGLAPGSVDAVLMHHTLEHVERPDEVLRQVFEVLAPGGVMYQSLPNHGSLKARLLGPHFGYGVTDEHLSHFSLRTLRRLVRRVGFRVQSTSTWSYRQDPRLLWDFCCRIGRREWLQRKCGVPLDRPMDVASYIRFLHEHRWAFFVCNRLWPARLCRWLGLGEDLHLVATKP
jgi:SAM-dependent methyltransferase